MTDPDFQLWGSTYLEGFCMIHPPGGVAKSFQLSRGISRLQGWADDAACRMDDEFPKDIEVPDNLCGAGLVVVSARVREFLQSVNVPDLEYLPVRVLNHKGKVAAPDCAIVNPLGQVDCIDIAASGVTWNQINPELISICKGLVLRADAVPAEVQVFRPKHRPSSVFVRTALARRMIDAGFTGLNFRDPISFDGS
jgi:hypothetical protein